MAATAKAAALRAEGLGVRTVRNEARYSADSMSLGGGYSVGGGGIGKDEDGKAQAGGLQTPGSTLPDLHGFSATAPVAMSAGGSSSSITRSGISGAKVAITNETQQIAKTGQDAATTVANINSDVSTDRDTSNSLTPLFNEREIRAGFAITQALVQETGTFLDNRAKEADAKNPRAQCGGGNRRRAGRPAAGRRTGGPAAKAAATPTRAAHSSLATA